MLYLLGELDAEQAQGFEKQLQSSPQLADELLRQAEVIAGLSQLPATSTHVLTTRSPLRLVASVLAIAACIALIALGVRTSSPDSGHIASLSTSSSQPSIPSEELLIARAWADSRLDQITTDDVLADLGSDDVLAFTADDAIDMDATLSWMFIGVSASLDVHPAGATNDG